MDARMGVDFGPLTGLFVSAGTAAVTTAVVEGALRWGFDDSWKARTDNHIGTLHKDLKKLENVNDVQLKILKFRNTLKGQWPGDIGDAVETYLYAKYKAAEDGINKATENKWNRATENALIHVASTYVEHYEKHWQEIPHLYEEVDVCLQYKLVFQESADNTRQYKVARYLLGGKLQGEYIDASPARACHSRIEHATYQGYLVYPKSVRLISIEDTGNGNGATYLSRTWIFNGIQYSLNKLNYIWWKQGDDAYYAVDQQQRVHTPSSGIIERNGAGYPPQATMGRYWNGKKWREYDVVRGGADQWTIRWTVLNASYQMNSANDANDAYWRPDYDLIIANHKANAGSGAGADSGAGGGAGDG